MPTVQLMVRVMSDRNQVEPGSVRMKSFTVPVGRTDCLEGVVNLTFEAASHAMDTVHSTFGHVVRTVEETRRKGG